MRSRASLGTNQNEPSSSFLGGAEVSELASLLGSIDMTTPVRPTSVDRDNKIAFSRPRIFSRNGNPDVDQNDSSPVLRELLQTSPTDFSTPKEPDDDLDFPGRYLTAVPTLTAHSSLGSDTIQSNQFSFLSGNHSVNNVTFTLGTDGQGVGELLDCLVFVNPEQKEDKGPIRYGNTVAIKVPSARERFLGIRDGQSLGFWRNLIGQGERWSIMRASHRGVEETSCRGLYARVGEGCLIQSLSQVHMDHYLSQWEGTDGTEPRLVHRDRAGTGSEVWQLCQFGSQPIPVWLNRPYLCGTFLVQTPIDKATAADAEARTFPGVLPGTRPPPPHLNTLSTAAQERVLARELLLAMCGVEGQYVRVGAGTVSTEGRLGTSRLLGRGHKPKLRDVTLVMDIDTVDRSLAAQIGTLLPICEAAIRLREFIRTHSRYEYGMVSHSLAAAMKEILREFDVLVAQFEPLLEEGRLSLQKMIFMLQPARVTLRTLDGVAKRLQDLTGGWLVDELFSATYEQGDQKAKKLHLHLLHRASKPFMSTLMRWLHSGELEDPYQEFMIQEDTTITRETLQQDFNAQYWENRYSLRGEHVPKILAGLAHKILTAGKYLAVVRESGLDQLSMFHGLSTTTDLVLGGRSERGFARNNPMTTQNNLEDDVNGFEGSPEDTGSVLDLDQAYLITDMVEIAYRSASEALLKLLQCGDTISPSEDRLVFAHQPHNGLLERTPYRSRESDDEAEDEGEDGDHDHRGVESVSPIQKEVKSQSLSSHLMSLRRFFLLENGDFFIQFMDTAFDELKKEAKDVALSRVQNLLQLALQTSTLSNDAHRDELTCTLATHNLIQHLHLIQSAGEYDESAPSMALNAQGLKGVEALVFDYKVEWPLSIVLSKRAITKYQLLSRLLFFSKHVELRILTVWQGDQSTKALDVRGEMGKTYFLRHRMLQFLQNFIYYLTYEVIVPRGSAMQASIERARDLDEVIKQHELFLDNCLKECLLASQNLLRILTKIMTTCLLYADQMERFSNANRVISEPRKGKKGRDGLLAEQRVRSEYIRSETSHETYRHMVTRFAEHFDEQLGEFLENLWTDSYRHHPQLVSLCARLDYNGYYSEKLASQAS